MKSLILIILDGFGYNARAIKSPWQLAEHPNFTEIEKYYPFATLQASGLAVGLPWGEPGNSEVGHLTMGAGKIIYSHLPRIISAIRDGTFFENKALLGAAEHVKKYKSSLHIMGLFSSGSVHAYADHLYTLLELCKRQNVEKVFLHLFTDGRDAPPREGANFLKDLESKLASEYPNAKIASVIGRHYALDREKNWPNIEKTYRLLTKEGNSQFEIASSYLLENYKRDIADEFVEPAFNPAAPRIKENDALIFLNFREDSAREISFAFSEENFDKFPREKIKNLFFVTMTEYESKIPANVAFPPLAIENPLAKVISKAGLKQLHIGESEKYAHVTYFFNGGKEEPFENEERILVPSPQTSHYDEIPEMSAFQIAETILAKLEENKYDFILVNLANADMVGHTGNFEACVKAIETLDKCVGMIVPKILELNGIAIITADHGNVEEKIYNITGGKRTNHTLNPVPFYLIGERWKRKKPLEPAEIARSYKKIDGTITDVAPTILEILELETPPEMIGKSLLSTLK